jgi:hypothetical protein
VRIDILSFQLALLLFWSLWFSIVLLTNSFEGLKKAGILPDRWKFASDNFSAIEKTLSIYTPPGWLAGFLFTGILLWQGLVVIFMWVAWARSFQAGSLQFEALDTAFTLSIGLWLAFLLADEILMEYDVKIDHLLLFLAQLATLLALHLLPGL